MFLICTFSEHWALISIYVDCIISLIWYNRILDSTKSQSIRFEYEFLKTHLLSFIHSISVWWLSCVSVSNTNFTTHLIRINPIQFFRSRGVLLGAPINLAPRFVLTESRFYFMFYLLWMAIEFCNYAIYKCQLLFNWRNSK